MKENLVEESSKIKNETGNKISILKDKIFIFFFIIDIISYLAFIYFRIINQKMMYIIFAISCSIISFVLIIVILVKLIKIKNKKPEKEYNKEAEKEEEEEEEEIKIKKDSEEKIKLNEMEEKEKEEKENEKEEKENEKEEKEKEEEEEEKEKEEEEQEKEEKEMKIEKIKEITKRQSNLLKENDQQFEERNENLDLIEKAGKLKSLTDEEIKKEKNKVQLLEDMNKMGTIMKETILEEKKTNPEKFFTTEEIIDQKESDLFALGIFSKALESQGMVTAIEKEANENDDDKKIAQTSLQFLINGMSEKPKYNLHFDFGEDKNKQLLNDENERKNFHDKLRKKLSEEYNINEEEIIITFPRKGSYLVTIIFKSIYFKLNENDLMNKFKNEKDELSKLKKIESGIILGGCKLTPSMLDYRGNNKDEGWAGEGEKRGGEEYIPPIGWIGYGLKVMDKYEDNIWLGMSNCPGEWCVAYHGVAHGQCSENVSKITGLITQSKFKPSTWGKATNDEDLRHPGKRCDLGVYCSPDINYAEMYAGITELNGEQYKCVLMLRVNPEKIRQSKTFPKEYILEPSLDEIRPYRILLKQINKY